jgi:hypothetical protein
VGGTTQRRGVGRGVGASVAVGRHGVVGSGPRGWRVTGAEIGGGSGLPGGCWNSNRWQDLNSKKKKSNLI